MNSGMAQNHKVPPTGPSSGPFTLLQMLNVKIIVANTEKVSWKEEFFLEDMFKKLYVFEGFRYFVLYI